MSKTSKRKKVAPIAILAGASVLAALAPQVHASISNDALIDKLEQKGILTSDEAKELRAESEASDTNLINQLPASKWQLSSAIKTIQLYGDVRLRYEYRGADNPFTKPAVNTTVGEGNSGEVGKTYDRERFRYAVRIGVRGDLYDDWSYGVRIETSSNPRSQFVTFGDDTGKALTSGPGVPAGGTPSDKTSDGLNIGQAWLGWSPASWLQIEVGKMPMPLYTTPMVWSSAFSPEGAYEKLQASIGPVDVFADAGQFDYQDPTASQAVITSDTFILAEQVGMDAHLGKSMFLKAAPVVYVYAGQGNPPPPRTTVNLNPAILDTLYYPFIGQGDPTGIDKGFNDLYNQIGINDLLIAELPMEFDFKIYKTPLGTLQARIFGDIAYNYEGDARARAAFAAEPAAFPGLKTAAIGENAAYQIGIGLGSDGPVYGPMQGLVYGTTAKKNTWEARFYWQHIDQYALDVNLLDADFFEGRGNLQGFYTSFAYSITDAIIATLRYGTADVIDSKLGTGGSNPDLSFLNPIRNYQIVQADLTWRF